MQQHNQVAAHAIAWDDDAANWTSTDQHGQYSLSQPRHSWLKRQASAAVWILIAWVVGTLVFELGAIG